MTFPSFIEVLLADLPLGVVASFALASVLIELTPGPNMTWLAMVAATHGRKPGYAAVGGVALGLAVIGVAAALGVTAIIDNSPLAYEILRWGGVLYLLYLAWEGWTVSAAATLEDKAQTTGMYFRRGLITNLLNPKAAVFYVSVLPAFLPPGAQLQQTLLLTAIYVAAATGIHAGIVALAGLAEPFLNNPRREQIARRVLSGALALIALWFAWKTAR